MAASNDSIVSATRKILGVDVDALIYDKNMSKGDDMYDASSDDLSGNTMISRRSRDEGFGDIKFTKSQFTIVVDEHGSMACFSLDSVAAILCWSVS